MYGEYTASTSYSVHAYKRPLFLFLSGASNVISSVVMDILNTNHTSPNYVEESK